jgi:hypothetical protein
MALKKDITLENGVTTSYHRILFIQSVINSNTSIAVLSYVSQESREAEDSETPPYKVSATYSSEYIENMTIEDAYNYLKNLPEFEGAEDI